MPEHRRFAVVRLAIEIQASVPAVCTFDLRAAIYSDDDIYARRDEIEACILEYAARDNFMKNSPPEITCHGFMAEGYTLANDQEPRNVLERSHRLSHDAELGERIMTGTTDARFFGLHDDTPGIVYGPRSHNIHGFDECVELDSVRRVTQTIALFMADWCGVEPLDD